MGTQTPIDRLGMLSDKECPVVGMHSHLSEGDRVLCNSLGWIGVERGSAPCYLCKS